MKPVNAKLDKYVNFPADFNKKPLNLRLVVIYCLQSIKHIFKEL